jgi:hypothetical protein
MKGGASVVAACAVTYPKMHGGQEERLAGPIPIQPDLRPSWTMTALPDSLGISIYFCAATTIPSSQGHMLSLSQSTYIR